MSLFIAIPKTLHPSFFPEQLQHLQHFQYLQCLLHLQHLRQLLHLPHYRYTTITVSIQHLLHCHPKELIAGVPTMHRGETDSWTYISLQFEDDILRTTSAGSKLSTSSTHRLSYTMRLKNWAVSG